MSDTITVQHSASHASSAPGLPDLARHPSGTTIGAGVLGRCCLWPLMFIFTFSSLRGGQRGRGPRLDTPLPDLRISAGAVGVLRVESEPAVNSVVKNRNPVTKVYFL
ncbi:MAG: hypothetical protein H6816_06935 [Phycisphaerales bacterium]|nr:hypothetical protein [Phycisphaerales bacterium]